MTESEYTFKVIVIGDRQVGKTSIIGRYVNNRHKIYYKLGTAIYPDYLCKQLIMDSNKVMLQLWDHHGARFGAITRIFFKQADGAVIVFDVTKNLDTVRNWKKEIDCKSQQAYGHYIPVILFANKKNLDSNIIDSEINDLCSELGITFWCYISAKDDYGISDGFGKLTQLMIDNHDVHNHKHSNDLVDIASKSIDNYWSCC